jgi:hypothetical protein
MTGGPVAKMLATQRPGGYWGQEEDYYVRTKYRGTAWSYILLAELAPDPLDERIRRSGDFLLRWSSRPDGGFTHLGGPDGGRKVPLACLSGNMVSSLVRLGFGDDPRLLLSYQHLNDMARRTIPLGRGRCERCRTGLVKVLKGIDSIPGKYSPHQLEATRASLADEVADLCLPGGEGKGPRPDWMEFGFPLMWNTDLIEILELVRLPASDDRVAKAMKMVMGKRDREGRWRAESKFTGRNLVSFGRRGSPSRWTTFRAMTMLKRLPD